MSSFSTSSAVTVDRCALNPCWWSGISRLSCSVGSRSHSNILIEGHRSETGLEEFDNLAALPGLSRGTTIEFFHICGILAVAAEQFGQVSNSCGA